MVAARTKALSKKRPAGRWAPAMGESKQKTNNPPRTAQGLDDEHDEFRLGNVGWVIPGN